MDDPSNVAIVEVFTNLAKLIVAQGPPRVYRQELKLV